jgi:GNAT superfamily N-acetyltransferase
MGVSQKHKEHMPFSVKCGVITSSDSLAAETDDSGKLIKDLLQKGERVRVSLFRPSVRKSLYGRHDSRPPMVLVERAAPPDRPDVERLIAAYHASEGLKPHPERIAWAVDQVLRNRFPGVLLVAREKRAVVGVALAVYEPSAELGRVLVVNDFFVEPTLRRKGAGRALATKLLDEAKAMHVDEIDLEILPANATATAFWKSVGFHTRGRTVYSCEFP